MASNVPITDGQGQSSVAAEQIGNVKYQVIKVVGGETGSTSVLGVNPDRSINVSVIGAISATLTGNPSISGTVGASVIGWVPTQPSNTSTIGVIQGSVAVAVISGVTFPANQSVSGTVGASIIGSVPTTLAGNPSISGNVRLLANITGQITNIDGQTVAFDNVPTSSPTINVSGFNHLYNGTNWDRVRGNSSIGTLVSTGASSVITTQGTSPWVVVGSVYGSGSVVSFQGGTQVTSLVSTVPSSVIVGASIFGQLPAGTAVLGSVAALQGTNPWIITGSVQGSFTPSGNQSVSGAINVSGSVLLGSSNASVISYIQNSVATVIIGGSIAASFTPPANQSVSGAVFISGSVLSQQTGTVITSLVSTVPSSVIVGASIFGQLPAGTAVLGSVAALQGTNPWIITGSVQGSFSPAANQSVSGTVGASVIGIAPVTLTANTIPTTASILLGVTANTNGSVLTTTGYPAALMQITSGPGASITGAINFEGSMDGTAFVPIQGYNLTTMAISSMATVESDWAFNTMGLQGIRARVSNWSVGSITARAVVSPADARPFSQNVIGNHSVSGALNVSGSVLLGSSNASVIGILQNSSIIAINAGSVVALSQGSVITLLQSSSILAVPVGSVITVFQAPSIVGTYGEDSAHTSTDKGLFTLAVRNDTLSSVTSADLDYSPITTGPMGETITANSPITKWVQGTADFRQGNAGASIVVLAAGGSSIFTYATAVQIANMGSASVLVTLASGGSTLGYTIAPAGGGSNIFYPNGLKTPGNFGFAASLSGIASVLVSAQGFISKT